MRQRRRGSYRSRYFQYSDVVRRPTIARLFSAPPQAIRSVGGALLSAQALQALRVQRESRRRRLLIRIVRKMSREVPR